MEMVPLWNSRTNNRSEIAPVLTEFQEIALNFASFFVVHTPRLENVAAHACAKNDTSTFSVIWQGGPPNFLVPLTQDDYNSPVFNE